MTKRTALRQHIHIDLAFSFLSFSLVLISFFYIFYSAGFSRCITLFHLNRVLNYIVKSKFTKKCMASGRRVGQRPDCHTFLSKFWHFQMAVSQWKLAWLTPNLGILWISVCSFRLIESIVANPIIYRLIPRPSRFEIRQYYCIFSTVQKYDLSFIQL